jgi:hypothetical protein
LKHVNVTQWVRGRFKSHPTKGKPPGRQLNRSATAEKRCAKQSKARTQAASLNSEKCIVVVATHSTAGRGQPLSGGVGSQDVRLTKSSTVQS